MPRTKQKREVHHQPSTHEVLLCLETMPKWVEILLNNSDKQYCSFLKWYAGRSFYKDRSEKLTVKQLAKDYSISDSAKITKWIVEAYNDIFELHIESPYLFQQQPGFKLTFYCKNYDDSASLAMCLPTIPRLYDDVRMPFLKGKLGTDHFWVGKVNHEIEDDELSTTVWLRGGFSNQYRDMLLQRAEFENVIGFYDRFTKYDFQLDEELRQWYK